MYGWDVFHYTITKIVSHTLLIYHMNFEIENPWYDANEIAN